MKLFVAGLSYKTAPVEVREKLAVHASRLRCQGCLLKLVEIYGVSPYVNGNVHRAFQSLASGDVDFTPHLYIKEGAEAVQHLFSVTGGLDSMVIGETEITGQVKQAYQAAQEARLTGRVTNRLFQTALQTAKEIRTETSIGRGATSVGSVAVELAEKIFDRDLSDKR
jgi:glutamyl-tRNA reductase